ncbi:hypothetical protein H6G65_08325 [Microcystis elabens FACHB-917]|nr:hypothetical protein [Microcystis elabens FACHB-917]
MAEMDMELLAALLGGPCRRLRDANHLDSHNILVWDQQRQPAIAALPFLVLLSLYPFGEQAGSHWSGQPSQRNGHQVAQFSAMSPRCRSAKPSSRICSGHCTAERKLDETKAGEDVATRALPLLVVVQVVDERMLVADVINRW